MLYHPRWQTVTHSFHFPRLDEKAKLHSVRKNTNCHFRHLKLKPLTSFQWQINYHELLIYLSKWFLLITIFFPFVQIYTNEAAVRPTLGSLALLACVTWPPPIQKLFADQDGLWSYSVASPCCPGAGAQPPFPRFDSAEQPSTAHRHRPPQAALRTLPGLSIFGYCSCAVGKHLLLN